MNPAMIVQIVSIVVPLIVELIDKIGSNETPQVGNTVAELVAMIGKAGKVKEINSIDVAALAGPIDSLVAGVHDAIEKAKARHADTPAA